ncbi:MAG TPA: response regulator [Chloroflexota bacterium]|nr:response regulator [Chloroflexota bacterium]
MSECRLLVVDQNPESRGVISEALIDQGYAVSVAAGGSEAIRAFADGRPSLALVHVEGASADQLRALRQLQEHAPDLPVLILGGNPEAKAVAEQVHSIGYVADPLNLDDLVDTVERVCPLVEAESS